MTGRTDGIVVGYDGSPGSDEALRWAAREAWARGTVLTIFLAWPPAELAQLGDGLIRDRAQQRGEEILARGIRLAGLAPDLHEVRTVTTEGSPAPHSSPEASDIPALFMAAIATTLGPADARAWFHDARLEAEGEDWILTTSTRFKASWIRGTLAHALAGAAACIGLSAAPEVRVRRS